MTTVSISRVGKREEGKVLTVTSRLVTSWVELIDFYMFWILRLLGIFTKVLAWGMNSQLCTGCQGVWMLSWDLQFTMNNLLE